MTEKPKLVEIPGFELLDDVEPARWVRESLMPPGNGEPFSGSPPFPAGAFLPPIYEAYARILHRDGHDGSLNPPQLGALAETLSGFTSTPENCFFCIWEGWGSWWPGELLMSVSDRRARRINRQLHRGRGPSGHRWSGPTRRKRMEHDVMDAILKAEFPLGQRRYPMFRGSRRNVESFTETIGQSPNIWWPEDRSWCVFTEIDVRATNLGGSRGCVAAVLADPRIGAEPMSITDRLGPSPFDDLQE